MKRNNRADTRALKHTINRAEERYNVPATPELWRDATNSIRSNRSINIGTFKGRRGPMSVHAVNTSSGLMFFLYHQKRIRTTLPPAHPYLTALHNILSSRKRLHPRNRKLLMETEQLLKTTPVTQLRKFQPAAPERTPHAATTQQTRRNPQKPQLE